MRLLRTKNPSLAFLMETRLKDEEMQRIVDKLGFKHCLIVDCNGRGRERSGGMFLLWKEEMNIQITSFSSNHIGGECYENDETNEAWFFAGVYDFPNENQKRDTWNMVRNVVHNMGERLVLFKDFNDVLQQSDKIGGSIRTLSQLLWSRNTIEKCGLQD